MNNELKPCPFCGKEATITETDYVFKSDNADDEYYHGYAVICCNSDCRPSQIYGGWEFETYGYASEEKAIEAWNKRV